MAALTRLLKSLARTAPAPAARPAGRPADRRARLGVEGLEGRELLAAALTATLDTVDKVLRVEGTEAACHDITSTKDGRLYCANLNSTIVLDVRGLTRDNGSIKGEPIPELWPRFAAARSSQPA